ncbi:MAG: NAD(P)/FAD-dependent oxidoreductase [Methanomicrobium sp.]|nr:NAD(P)/FAD-dependent oxidoreductase [Methanomicrobium sp.]
MSKNGSACGKGVNGVNCIGRGCVNGVNDAKSRDGFGVPFVWDAAIVGGGPAGLICAEIASGGGRNRVLVLEKKSSCGRKLLITGQSQCNMTHGGDIKEFFGHYGGNGQFLKASLMGFSNRDLLKSFEMRGLKTETDGNGKVFPVSRRAADVLEVLLKRAEECGVDVRCGEPVRSAAFVGGDGRDDGGVGDGSVDEDNGDGGDGIFEISTDERRYYAKNLVIACGCMTYPATGSEGDGYGLAESLGHTIAPVAPALCAFVIGDYPFASLSGISFPNASISLYHGNKKIRENTGDILFTHKGVSGPGILHISRYAAAGDFIRVCFIEGMTAEKFRESLTRLAAENPKKLVKSVLSGVGAVGSVGAAVSGGGKGAGNGGRDGRENAGHDATVIPERFVRRVMEIAGADEEVTCAHLTKENRKRLTEAFCDCKLTIAALGGVNEAMVTRGGVSLKEINPRTMESKLCSGLYFAGEVMDIDGDTGGYNLQAAFSTGYAAGAAIYKKLQR